MKIDLNNDEIHISLDGLIDKLIFVLTPTFKSHISKLDKILNDELSIKHLIKIIKGVKESSEKNLNLNRQPARNEEFKKKIKLSNQILKILSD